jgi:hydrogenase maturation factor HypF (carbamoyltransferase family)
MALRICREKTYDGEPAMKLESAAIGGQPEAWDLAYAREDWLSAEKEYKSLALIYPNV